MLSNISGIEYDTEKMEPEIVIEGDRKGIIALTSEGIISNETHDKSELVFEETDVEFVECLFKVNDELFLLHLEEYVVFDRLNPDKFERIKTKEELIDYSSEEAYQWLFENDSIGGILSFFPEKELPNIEISGEFYNSYRDEKIVEYEYNGYEFNTESLHYREIDDSYYIHYLRGDSPDVRQEIKTLTKMEVIEWLKKNNELEVIRKYFPNES